MHNSKNVYVGTKEYHQLLNAFSFEIWALGLKRMTLEDLVLTAVDLKNQIDKSNSKQAKELLPELIEIQRQIKEFYYAFKYYANKDNIVITDVLDFKYDNILDIIE